MPSHFAPPRLLEPGSIHVLPVRVADPLLPMAELEAAISDAERERAGRFLHDDDARRHVIGRGFTRLVLGGVLGVAPTSIPFEYSRNGKPLVPGGPSFSISHSGGFVLLAFAADGRLGVDVEAVRVPRDLLKLARRAFVPEEAAEIAAMREDERLRPFFRIWSRKEAILKALGTGLTALRTIRMSWRADVDNALLEIAPPEDRSAWTVRSLACHPSVESAVAWDRPLRRIELLSPWGE